MPILYGRHLSPYVRKVLMLVEAGGIEITHRNDITPFPPPAELLAVNPRGKIPALKDGDLTLGESSVICAYLERRYGPSGLYPEDPEAYARALWFEKYMGRVSDARHRARVLSAGTGSSIWKTGR